MDSLSIFLSSFPSLKNHSNSIFTSKFSANSFNCHHTHVPFITLRTKTPYRPPNQVSTDQFSTNFANKIPPLLKKSDLFQTHLTSHLCFLCMGLYFPLSCLASESSSSVPTEELSSKINLEAILVSIDDFFNRNPFFVAGVTFIWLVVIPLTEEYLQKYKFISAINAFRKLRDDPNAQLLDIRDKKSLGYLNSPNLKILNKDMVQVEFREGDEDGFVKKVMDNSVDPSNTIYCILDNFDGNSMKVAELLVKNGFKEAYAIQGGIRGKNGWQEIQETLLPPSVHIYPRKRAKVSQQLITNGGVNQQSVDNNVNSSFTSCRTTKEMESGCVNKPIDPNPQTKLGPRSSSPFPNYPDLKPPSSPTPSQPRK